MSGNASLDRKIYSFFKKGQWEDILVVQKTFPISTAEQYALKAYGIVNAAGAGACKFALFGNMLLNTGALVAEVWGGYSKTRLSGGQATGQVGAHYFEMIVDAAVANCPSFGVIQLAGWVNGALNAEHGFIVFRDYGSAPLTNLFNIMDITSGTGKLWYGSTLRIRIGSAAKYIPLSTTEGQLTIAGMVAPSTNDGAALGSTSLKWSDLFLASGAVINFNSGNLTLTHSAGLLTLSGALTVSGTYIELAQGGTIASSVDTGDGLGRTTITDDNIVLVGTGYHGICFGGLPDWGVGGTGQVLDGTGFDWVTATIGIVNSGALAAACAASYHSLTVAPASHTTASSFFGTWTELYLQATQNMDNAANCAAVWGQVEAGAAVSTTSLADCFTAGGYFNVIFGDNMTNNVAHVINGVRVQAEISTTGDTNNGRIAAFECLKKAGTLDWDYGLYISNATTGIALSGTFTTGIDLTGATITPDANRTSSVIAIGDRLGAKSVTMAASANYNLDPVQMNLNIIGVAPTSSTVNGIYINITHALADMANLRLKNADWTVAVSKNLQDAYCIQTEIDVADTAGVSGQCAAVSAVVNISGTGTINEVQALYASIGGSGVFTSAEAVVAKLGYSATGTAAKAVVEVGCAAFATATHGILFSGQGALTTGISFEQAVAMTDGIDFSGIDPVFGSGNACLFKYGKRGTAKSVSMTSRWEPIQLVLTSAAAPSVAGTTMNLIYVDLRTGIAQANARLKVADWTIGVAHALTDAYVTQMEIVQSGTGAVTGQMCTLSATMSLGGAATIEEAQALYVAVSGAGAVTSDELTVAKFGFNATGKKAKAIIEMGAAAFASAEAGIRFDGEGALDSIFSFEGLADGTVVLEDSAAAPDKAGSIKITMPSGAVGYINVYDGTRA